MVFAISEGVGPPSFLPNSRTFSSSQKKLSLFSFYLFLLAPGPREPLTYFLSRWSCLFWILHINGIIQHTDSFLYLLHILSIMPLRFIHVLTWIGTSFLSAVEYYAAVWDGTFCLPLHQLTDIWVASISGLLWIMLLWVFMHKGLCGHMFSILPCIYLWVEMQGYGEFYV